MTYKSKLITQAAALICITLIIASRKPILLMEPRFWWDEGSNFAYAFNGFWLKTLLIPRHGYYSLVNNLTGLVQSRLFPIRTAPFFSTYVAFIFQIIPHIVIWWGRSVYWNSPQQRLVASLIILFTSLNCTLWLNIVTAQFHLSLIAFLLLMEDWHNRSRHCVIGYSTLLAVAGLTGVMACFLMPLFLYKYYTERSLLGKSFIVILLIACGFQFVSLLWSITHNTLDNRTRYTAFSLWHFPIFYLRGTIKNIFYGSTLSVYGRHQILTNALSLGMLVFICTWLGTQLKMSTRFYFLSGFFLLSILNQLASIKNDNIQPRYYYVPNVILVLYLAQIAFLKESLYYWRKTIASILLVIAFIAGFNDFYFHYTCYNPLWPKWENEVSKWEADSAYILHPHPVGSVIDWSINLNPKAH